MADSPLEFGLADVLGAAGVLFIAVLGFVWFVKAGRLFENRTYVYTLCCLHFFLVFSLPWVADIDCEQGSPWWCHLTYVATLALAPPILGGYYVSHTDTTLQESSSFLWRAFYMLFLYCCTFFAAADQYLDMTTAAKAWSCDSMYWESMLATLCASICLQGAMAALLVRCIVKLKKNQCTYSWIFFVLVTAGMNPDNLVFFGEGFDATNLKMLVGVVAIVRFMTEALVEAGLETAFAFEQSLTGSNLALVVASVTCSGLVAARSAAVGVKNLCGRDPKTSPVSPVAAATKVQPQQLPHVPTSLHQTCQVVWN